MAQIMSLLKITPLVLLLLLMRLTAGVLGGRAQDRSNLRCYECSVKFIRKWRPTNCQLSPKVSATCYGGIKYCQVTQISSLGNIIGLKRRCAPVCQNGCRYINTGGMSWLLCSKCCTTNLCNYGSGAKSIIHRPPHLGNSLFILIYFIYCIVQVLL